MTNLQQKISLLHVPGTTPVAARLRPELLQQLRVLPIQLLYQVPIKGRAAQLVCLLVQSINHELGVPEKIRLSDVAVVGQVTSIVVYYDLWSHREPGVQHLKHTARGLELMHRVEPYQVLAVKTEASLYAWCAAGIPVWVLRAYFLHLSPLRGVAIPRQVAAHW